MHGDDEGPRPRLRHGGDRALGASRPRTSAKGGSGRPARRTTRAALALLVVTLANSPGVARADDGLPPHRYFYKGYDYGSQSLFNPFYVLLNRGFDVLQLRPGRRYLWQQDNLKNERNVFRNMLSPFSAIGDAGGAWKLTREELLPLSYTATSARWVPNYGLHLIGGGTTYTALREWFDDHDAPLPAAWAIATLYAAAFVNEGLENDGVVGANTDCLADLYVFDLAGILLFSLPGVNEFFSREVIVSDWSLQPGFTSRGELHNTGNYYSVKWPLPFYERLRAFGYIGFATLGGLSYQVGSGYSVSAAAGGKVGTFENTDSARVANIVIMKPSGALFLDRNNSLLASVQLSDVSDYFLHVNVYPNAFTRFDPAFGFWSVVSKDGHWLVGLSMTHTLGFGLAGGTL